MFNQSILNKKQVISWAFFDFANSSYSAVITAVIFPVYYANTIVGNIDGNGDLWWGRAISFSMFLVAVFSPILGGIADYCGNRKSMLYFFVILCSVSVGSFVTLDKGDTYIGFILIIFANFAMESSLVFYNSYLPIIVGKSYLGRVSSLGFAVGYLGSILSLILAQFLAKANKYNAIWLLVSGFFLIFSIPLYIFLPKDDNKNSIKYSITKGIEYILEKINIIKKHKDLKKFLLAYLLYADGINTVIVFSTIFAVTTLGFTNLEIIKLFIVVQITALIGSLLTGKIIDIKGPKFVIIISLFFWIIVTIGAYFTNSKMLFFIIASIAGLGLGTIQSSSRTLFSYFIPKDSESEYFGIYSLAGKTSSIIGPLLFGQLSSLSGSQRPAILSVTLFFLFGFLIVLRLKEPSDI